MEKTLDAKKQVSESMFIIRGFAIFLVVVGHVIGGKDTGIRQLYDADLLGLAQLHDFIYTFHMPIFFLASGFSFTAFSKSSRKLLDLIKSRAQRLLIPLMCWAPIYYIFRSAMGKIDFKAFGIIESIINPDFIFWFFPAIFLASILGFLCLKFFRSWLLYTIATLSLLAMSFYLEGNISIWFYFNSFYFLGCVTGSYFLKKDFEKIPLSRWQIVLVVSSITFMMLFTYSLLNSKQLEYSLVRFINGLLSFIALYLAIDSRSKFSLPDFVQPISKMNKNIFLYLGKISMSVYVLHVICGSTTRTILAKIGILEPSLQFTLGLLASVMGPVLIHRLLCKNHLFLSSIGEAK